MKLIYVGHSTTPVEVLPVGITAIPGVPVEIPEKIARSLLQQSAWEKAKPKKKEE